MRTSVARCLLLILALACLAAVAWAADAEQPEQPKPLPYIPGSWTLVLLPDTQGYSHNYPHIFVSQTKWIVQNKDARQIAFVLHEGDITNNDNVEQWTNAKAALKILDGEVPYALAPGNHDYAGGKASSRETMLNTYFPVSLFKDRPTFGGVFEDGRIDNSYHLFTAGGRDWLAVALEWAPRDEVVQWADRVLKKHAHRSAIIVTHAYLYSDDTRYDHETRKDQKWSPHKYPTAKLPGGVNDGEELWQKLISPNPNVVFVFCGHVLNDGAGRLTSAAADGHPVHQILANYQTRKEAGEGYLRLVEFLPDGKTVQVKTCSPYLDAYMTDEQNQFTLALPPSPPGSE